MKHLPLHVRVPIEENNPSITRCEEKCIKCGMCKDVCTNAIGVHVLQRNLKFAEMR